jgi:hypothetical protein
MAQVQIERNQVIQTTRLSRAPRSIEAAVGCLCNSRSCSAGLTFMASRSEERERTSDLHPSFFSLREHNLLSLSPTRVKSLDVDRTNFRYSSPRSRKRIYKIDGLGIGSSCFMPVTIATDSILSKRSSRPRDRIFTRKKRTKPTELRARRAKQGLFAFI